MIFQKDFFALLMLVLVTNIGFSQIVTTKKEAIKKGLYQKTVEVSKQDVKLNEKTNTTATSGVSQKDLKNLNKIKNIVLNDKEDDDLILTPTQNYLATQILNNAMQFIGVRYRTGGESTAGMDCSGMITAAFKIFDLKLPRSSNDMARVGDKVSKHEAEKGDLIFFRTHGRGINHVGMVIEVINDEVKFLHSSTSKGVMISSTKENYYKKSFVQINKVLKN